MSLDKNFAVLEDKCVEVSSILKLMAHPDRLRILCLLSQREMSVSELESAVAISQSSTSQFLNRLKLEGILDSKRMGTRVVYFISDHKVIEIVNALYGVFCASDKEASR